MRQMPRSFLLSFVAILGMASLAAAQSNVSDTERYAWGANIGWVDWRSSAATGAVFRSNIAAGYLYAANVGWIHLGDGTPASGLFYSNTSASDYGVNVDSTSNAAALILKGYGYGANIGWISFDVQAQAGAANQPRIEKATGLLKGMAWGANIGWLPLESLGAAQVRVRLLNASAHWDLYQ